MELTDYIDKMELTDRFKKNENIKSSKKLSWLPTVLGSFAIGLTSFLSTPANADCGATSNKKKDIQSILNEYNTMLAEQFSGKDDWKCTLDKKYNKTLKDFKFYARQRRKLLKIKDSEEPNIDKLTDEFKKFICGTYCVFPIENYKKIIPLVYDALDNPENEFLPADCEQLPNEHTRSSDIQHMSCTRYISKGRGYLKFKVPPKQNLEMVIDKLINSGTNKSSKSREVYLPFKNLDKSIIDLAKNSLKTTISRAYPRAIAEYKLINDSNKDVIRELPSMAFLAMAKRILKRLGAPSSSIYYLTIDPIKYWSKSEIPDKELGSDIDRTFRESVKDLLVFKGTTENYKRLYDIYILKSGTEIKTIGEEYIKVLKQYGKKNLTQDQWERLGILNNPNNRHVGRSVEVDSIISYPIKVEGIGQSYAVTGIDEKSVPYTSGSIIIIPREGYIGFDFEDAENAPLNKINDSVSSNIKQLNDNQLNDNQPIDEYLANDNLNSEQLTYSSIGTESVTNEQSTNKQPLNQYDKELSDKELSDKELLDLLFDGQKDSQTPSDKKSADKSSIDNHFDKKYNDNKPNDNNTFKIDWNPVKKQNALQRVGKQNHTLGIGLSTYLTIVDSTPLSDNTHTKDSSPVIKNPEVLLGAINVMGCIYDVICIGGQIGYGQNIHETYVRNEEGFKSVERIRGDLNIFRVGLELGGQGKVSDNFSIGLMSGVGLDFLNIDEERIITDYDVKIPEDEWDYRSFPSEHTNEMSKSIAVTLPLGLQFKIKNFSFGPYGVINFHNIRRENVYFQIGLKLQYFIDLKKD